MIGEGGGSSRSIVATGQFLWANPFPFDTPDFLISNIDGKTGKVFLNKNKLFTRPVRPPRDLLLEHAQLLADGLSPGHEFAVRALRRELSRHDVARARTASRARQRGGIPRPGSDPNTWAGLMKVNMSTGEMKPIYMRPRAEQRRGADDGGQRGVLGRSRSEVPRLRRRERQDALGADARRTD